MWEENVLFYLPDPDLAGLELLLEHQRALAVPSAAVDLVIGLKEEYPVDNLVLINPTNTGLEKLLEHWESDQIMAGGYCTVKIARNTGKILFMSLNFKARFRMNRQFPQIFQNDDFFQITGIKPCLSM